jgi:hypothetical protein
MTDEKTAAIRAEALRVGEAYGLVDKDIIVLLDTSDCSVNADGTVRGVREAMVAMRKAKPHLFNLPTRTSRDMSDAERYQTLLAIKKRDDERSARRLAAKPLVPGEPVRTAKDFTPEEYRQRLQEIRRRHN